MCGTVGYYPLTSEHPNLRREAFCRLLTESQVRGMHAYGIFQPASGCLKSGDLQDIKNYFLPEYPMVAHTRYSTSGDWRNMENNQPIQVEGLVLVFNGVIHMGTREEFNAAFQVECLSNNDGEVLLRCMDGGTTGVRALQAESFILNTRGSFAGCWFDDGIMFVGRNPRRPLWYCEHLGARWFASTRDIFLRAEFPEPLEVPVGVQRVG